MAESWVRIGLLLLLTGLIHPRAIGAGFQTPAITPEQLHDRQQAQDKVLVVDVRDPAEFRVGHVPGAVNLPAAEIADHFQEIEGQTGVVVYCIAGTRTQLAEQTLIEHKVPNVFHLDGGLTAWLDSGYPVEKGAGRRLGSAGGK
jgi:rhodanese-related sulfurtransferase